MHRFSPALLATVLALAVPAQASAAQLVVGFESDTSARDRAAALVAAHAGAGSAIARVDAQVIRVPDAAAPAVQRALSRMGAVRYVQVDGAAHASWTPNDPSLGSQWAIAKVRAATAWDTALGASTLVAIVDSGVDYDHPDLSGKVERGYDYVAGDTDPYDEAGHGTHVAGIAAAATNNGIGVAGMAPSARILAVRVLDSSGSGTMSNVARGVTYAVDHGARVVNLSLGGTSGSTALLDAINYAVGKGVVVTCAAGNSSTSTLHFPAAYDGCVSVAATDSADAKASFSNWGTGLDLAAPGASILSTVRGGGYQYWNGTSMATPMVSGLAALLYSKGLDRAGVIRAMETTAKDLGAAGYDTTFGFGRIDAAAAVASGSTTTPTPTPTPTPTNAAPTCANLSLPVARNGFATVALRCSDTNGDTLSYAITRQPRYGRLTNVDSAKGTATYTPFRYFRGSDSFTYTARDAASTAAGATVAITVG